MLIDIGANLTHESFQPDLAAVLASAQAKGVSQLVVTGASKQSSQEASILAQRFSGQLVSTAGIHPHHAEETNDQTICLLRQLCQQAEVRAVGETGLDYFRDLTPKKTQIASFEAHIELAIETGLPLFLHERDAYPDFKEILMPYRHQLGDIVVHCFTGAAEALHAYLDLDCYIGITGWICDERRGKHLIPLVQQIPDNRLMLETDAPYLMPRTIKPKPRTRRNEPQNLPYICDFVAQCRGESFLQTAQLSTKNAIHFFNLDPLSATPEDPPRPQSGVE
ncbi:MAG: TatD family hydrolase [Pseudomonadales bacterium]|nr:TatD family hydrolase [Pseudomonadales bacterium]